MLTASREPRFRERALELGASAFLSKPMREATLSEALRAAQIGWWMVPYPRRASLGIIPDYRRAKFRPLIIPGRNPRAVRRATN